MATAIETCTVCGERFNNTRAGDKHRVIDYKYTLIRLKNGKLQRMPENAKDFSSLLSYALKNGAKICSEHGEQRRCLSSEEMRGIGMRQEKNGCWNGGGNWIGAPWKS